MRMKRRREFLVGMGTVLAGLAAAPAAAFRIREEAGEEMEKEFTPLIERPFVVKEEEIVRRFLHAPKRVLYSYYQQFFPIFLHRDVFASVGRICESARDQQIVDVACSPRINKLHRLVAIPAVAAIHAIPFVDSNEQRAALWDIIDEVTRDAADTDPALKKGERETIQIVIHTMTALLLNPRAWHTIRASSEILRTIEFCCASFLRGDQALLSTAIGCYQFLLTYDWVLSNQKNPEEKRRLRGQIAGIKKNLINLGGSHYAWIRRFESAWGDCLKSGIVVEHYSELLFKRHLLSPHAPERRVADLAALVRLQMNHTNELLFLGNIASPLVNNLDRLKDNVKEWNVLLGEHGFNRSAWVGLRPLGRRLMDKDTMNFVDGAASSEITEPRPDPILGLIPFINSEPEESVSRVYRGNAQHLRRDLKHAARTGSEGCYAVWRSVAIDGAQCGVFISGWDFKQVEFFDGFRSHILTEDNTRLWTERMIEEGDKANVAEKVTLRTGMKFGDVSETKLDQRKTNPVEVALPGRDEDDLSGERSNLNRIAAISPQRWRHRLSMYHGEEKIGVRFKNDAELEEVLDRIWNATDDLFEMPWAYPGGNVLIVPTDAWAVFEAKGYGIERLTVLDRERTETF